MVPYACRTTSTGMYQVKSVFSAAGHRTDSSNSVSPTQSKSIHHGTIGILAVIRRNLIAMTFFAITVVVVVVVVVEGKGASAKARLSGSRVRGPTGKWPHCSLFSSVLS